MNLKQWAEKRSLQKSEPEKIKLPRSFSDLLSSLNKEDAILLKSYLSQKSAFELDVLEKCLRDKAFFSSLLKNQPSNFHRKHFQDKIYKSAKDVSEALYYLSAKDLSKAVHPEEFKTSIQDQADKDAPRWLDHKDQMAKFPAHPNYTAFLKHPDRISSTVPKHDGISSKMVHELWHDYTGAKPQELPGTEHFMTKPYHQSVEERTNHLNHFPQGGWSTMATKALFNAGNIGHLAEDVGVHEHEGTPVTVHRFHPKAEIVWNHEQGQTDPLQIHQVGVMDYLANNVDRHAANLMTYPLENGKSNILAIDHERNFGYNHPLSDQVGWDPDGEIKESPFHYMAHSNGLSNASEYLPQEHQADQNYKPLADWWSKNGMKIQKEMASQLGSVKDSVVRKHMYDNFMGRWDRMNDWVKNAQTSGNYVGKQAEDMFEPALMKKFKQPVNKKILETLPEKPKDALSAVYDIVNRKTDYSKSGLNGKQVSQLQGVVNHIVSKMTPEEMADVYKSSKDNPNWNSKGAKKHFANLHIRPAILNHLYNPEGFTEHAPAYKLNHMKAISDLIDSDPKSNDIEKAHSDKLKGLINKTVRGAA